MSVREDGFVHLHSHSEFSFRDACMSVETYVKKVKALGMKACALTDHGNMHGVYKFFKTAKKEGIKPIVGVEAYVLPYKEMADSENTAERHIKYHLTLLAKDEKGYLQLAKATTKAQLLKDRKTYPRMTYDDMKTLFVGGHVVALSGCVQGELSQILLDRDNPNAYEEAKQKALFYQDIFGEGNYFIEIQNHGIDLELEVLPKLVQISKDTGIPLVATNDAHYAEKQDSEVRDWVVALRFGQKVSDPDFQRDCGELYVKSAQEMANLFSAYPEAVENTLKIADMCNFEFRREKRFPHFRVPDGKTEDEHLRDLAYEGLYKRFPDFEDYSQEEKDKMVQRIEHELGVISKLNYAGYHLITQDFLQEGRRIGMVGPGRGSAVGSFVCYLIGITDINPLPYDLVFERFLNEDRVSDPDIDSDFCDRREDVIEYVKKKYGNESVCSIVTFGSMAARAAIRNVGRVTGRPLDLCDLVAKMVPNKPGITLDEAIEENPDLKKAVQEDASVRTLIEDAKKFEGLVIQSGVHAAGVIIADSDISDYVPLMFDEEENLWICQFDKYDVEELGLLKMDFLGLKNLTIIKRTLEDIERNHGVKMTIYDIPLDDQRVYKEIFSAGKTKAVFQFESSGMVQLLKRFQPEKFEDLILLNAAYRPGPLQYLDQIIEVKYGKRKPKYIVKELEEILSVTYGSPIYQEQIQRIFHRIAGFSLGVADIIRRAMANKDLRSLERYLPAFKEALIKLGASKEEADRFANELMEFAKYAFNKSHSTAYAYLAFITAWLKLYYPVEYMANAISLSTTKELPVYIKEARDIGIPVLPPSINESGKLFTPTKAGTIRFGLSSIKNVGKSADEIIAEREANGPYQSMRDFAERQIKVRGGRALYKQVRESLILTGAFDEFAYNRKQTLQGSEKLVDALKEVRDRQKILDAFRGEYSAKIKEAKENGCDEREFDKLIRKVDRMLNARIRNLDKANQNLQEFQFDSTVPEFEKSELLRLERELIGFYASGHPLDDYQAIIQEKSELTIGDIDEEHDGRMVLIVGQISDFKQLYRKRDGAAMGKFLLEDLTGTIEAIAFTKAYAKFQSNIVNNEIVVVQGRVQAEVERDEEGEIIHSDIQLVVQEVSPITFDRKVYVKIPNVFAWDMAKEVVLRHEGSAPLYVYVTDQKQIYKTKFFVKASTSFLEEFSALFGEGHAVIAS